MKKMILLPIAASLLVFPVSAAGSETYRVGPGEKHRTISQVTHMLRKGDVVELSGDITDSFTLAAHGTPDKPIVIRGLTTLENGRVIRPRITLNNEEGYGIRCLGDWNVVEGLDITGALGETKASATAVYQESEGLVLRNCRIHHNGIAFSSSHRATGSTLIEFCEFDSNGYGPEGRGVYLNSYVPRSTATVQFCHFHDNVGGPMLKSSMPRNIMRYNWFENIYVSAITIIDNDVKNPAVKEDAAEGNPYPLHSDIVGNVFLQGWSPGPNWAVLQLGGEGPEAPGTEGDFSIAHNLFVTSNNGQEPSVALHVRGCVNRVSVYNNVLIPYGVKGLTVYERGPVWDTDRMKAFERLRGSLEPVVEGSNNWISQKAVGVPHGFARTIRSINPKFIDPFNADFRPRSGSPLAGAGLSPLPKGRVVDLVPEYEPQRGIPIDLKPKPRRRVTPPSIGPFEVED